VENTQVVEIDHPAAQTLKKARLRRALGGLPAHVLFIPVDFDRGCLDDAMRSSGFQPRERIFFIWEGVTQYITAEEVDAILRTISRITRAESTLVFTYIWRGIIDGSARSQAEERIVASAQRLGSPWIFGLEPADIRPYLAERGLLLVEDVGADEYRERYLEPAGRRMNVFEGERLVLARVVGTHAQA
jgi:methyltransferase (TIGR00027 family)